MHTSSLVERQGRNLGIFFWRLWWLLLLFFFATFSPVFAPPGSGRRHVEFSMKNHVSVYAQRNFNTTKLCVLLHHQKFVQILISKQYIAWTSTTLSMSIFFFMLRNWFIYILSCCLQGKKLENVRAQRKQHLIALRIRLSALSELSRMPAYKEMAGATKLKRIFKTDCWWSDIKKVVDGSFADYRGKLSTRHGDQGQFWLR